MEELRLLTASMKSAFVADLKKDSMDDVVQTHHRVHQWAGADAKLPHGISKSDLVFIHNAIVAELKRRFLEANPGKTYPPHDSPLTTSDIKGGTSSLDLDGEERCHALDNLWEAVDAASNNALRRLPEHRSFALEELRVIRSDDGEPATIKGHAAVFDQWSEDLGGFREKIQPGAFTNTIAKDDIRALWNHNPDYVLGRNKAGTLKLAEDDRGLAVAIMPPDTQWARDAMVSIDRGDVSQMSFGFYTVSDDWNHPEDGDSRALAERELVECKVFDVSPVAFPAYPATDVAIRALGVEGLTDVFTRVAAGDELSDDDRQIVHKAIAALRALMPEPEAPETDVPVDYRWLRLQLDTRIESNKEK